MLTKADLEKIARLLNPIKKVQESHTKELSELKRRLDINTKSTIEIEQKINTALELRLDVIQVKQKVQDHEERISHLEKFS